MRRQHTLYSVSKETVKTECTGLIYNTTGKSGSEIVNAALFHERAVKLLFGKRFLMCYNNQFFCCQDVFAGVSPSVYIVASERILTLSCNVSFHIAKRLQIAEARGKNLSCSGASRTQNYLHNFRAGLTVSRKDVSVITWKKLCSHRSMNAFSFVSIPRLFIPDYGHT